MTTIILIFVGLLALLWFSAFLMSGLAYLVALMRSKKNENNLNELIAEPKQFSSSENENQEIENKDESSLMIIPKDEIDIDSKIAKINELIYKYKVDGNNIVLLTLGGMIGLDASEILGDKSKLAEKFEEYSRSIIGKDKFKVITNSRITIGDYTESIPEGVNVYYNLFLIEYFDRFESFLINFKQFFDLIESKSNVIAAQKRTLVTVDEFGDSDGSQWIEYLQRFAEKMNLLNPHSAIASDFEAVHGYFKILKLDKFQGKLLGYLFAITEHFQKIEDPFTNVFTGVDFELHLKSMMESQLPGIYVETTPATGDHGADLVIRFKGVVIAIQAKYYTGSVGNGAVQEIHSGMAFYDADYGMVVTQSKYTEHAKSLASKLNIYLEDVDTFIPKIIELSR